MSTHEIVILGSNFGGIGIAHYLLKHTIPSLKSLDPSRSYHVLQVGPSSTALFKLSLPRVIADPSQISWDQVALPFLDGFSKYSASEYDFLQGLATSIDEESKAVTIQTSDGSSNSVHYDSLIIATGFKTNSPLWTVSDNLKNTQAEIMRLHRSLPGAKSILVAGGGPVGVETAGEIAYKYPNKKITLLSGGSRLLPRLAPSTSTRAEQSLTAYGVKVIHNLKTFSAEKKTDGHTTTVHLSDGSHQTYDIFIDATGGKPATDFLPSTWLDSTSRVKTHSESLRVEGVPGVYALGDASSSSGGGAMDVASSHGPLASSLARDIVATFADSVSQAKAERLPAFKERNFKPLKGTQAVPIGKKGVGQISGWKIPSLLIWIAKGKSFLIELATPMATGENVAKP